MSQPEEQDIPKGEDYVIRNQTPEERERLDTTEEVPEYRIKMSLSEEQIKRLTDQFFLEFQALEDERGELGLKGKWEERDNQYDGEIQSNKRLMFNLHVQQSKIKVDAVVRAINEAFLDSDPIVDISPRPEMTKKNGFEISDKQTQFIDYSMDEEVKPEAQFTKIAQCAVKKFVGIGKICWAYEREKRKREETYEGKNEIVGAQNGQPVISNEGLKMFLDAYPDAEKQYKGYLKKLIEGKNVNIVVTYHDTIRNNPQLKYIKLENFYCRNACEYWEGLRTEHCLAERESYSYWELLEKEENEEFENVESLFASSDDKSQGESKEYMTKSYDVLEATMYFKLDEGDDDEVKIKAWFGEEKKTFIGAILYPYYAIDIDYIPFYVKLNDYGFYGDARSVMYDIKDSNIAQDVLLNLALHGAYSRNIITPIVKEGSEIETIFLENKFQEGRPIPVDEMTDDVNKAFGFVQWPNMDLNGLMMLGQILQRNDGAVTGVSDLQSGRESPTDPTAPAAKTIALLQQSGINIKDYIRTFLPSFNIFVENLLQLYYQMSQEGRKYKIRRKSEGVTGSNPFGEISRDEMIAKTNVQARAASFVFDKANEKIEATVAYQMAITNPYAAQNTQFIYEAFLTAMRVYGPRWKNLVENKLPSPEEFKNQQLQIAVKAVQMIMQNAQKQKETVGIAPQITPDGLADGVTKAQAESYNPALVEAQKK